jgi:ABC-type transport system substrate-binding protein
VNPLKALAAPLIASTLFLSAACADTTAPPAPASPQPGFSLTIYSQADPATFDPQEFLAKPV